MTTLTHLECASCGTRYDPAVPHNLCECGGPLLARYDLETARRSWSREWMRTGPSTMWRYAPVLPVRKLSSITSLGEGMTPLIRAERLSARLGARNLWVKDDGANPAGSLKARGLSCAVSMAVELGIKKAALASAGNAAGALASYAAAANIEAHVFMPRDTPQANQIECRAAGASVTLVDGLIGDCARLLSERKQVEGWFDMSALKEPYRIEGKKTMAYEVAEQLNWQAPDAIVCPAGGGAALIAIWKAFEEMEALGWISGKRPKLIAVQAAGCQPIVRAFHEGRESSEPWANASTLAAGLRITKTAGDFLVLKAVRESGGTAIAVSDAEMLDAGLDLASTEGIFPAPEGAATVAAVRKLITDGVLNAEERIVLCNTGTGLKYLEAYSTRFPRHHLTEQDKLGGLITPR